MKIIFLEKIKWNNTSVLTEHEQSDMALEWKWNDITFISHAMSN